MEETLKLGCFEDWAYGDTMILFSGYKGAICKLEQLFRNLSKGIFIKIRFDQQEFVKTYYNIELKGQLEEKDIGLVRNNNTNSFTLSLSSDTWDSFADLISFYLDNDSGHQYLDCYSQDGTQIMVSIGEYSDDWIGWKE